MKRTMLIAVVVMGLVFGLVAYASANVSVTAKVGAKASLTMDDGTAALGTVLPEASANDDISFTVKANKGYTISRSITTGTFEDPKFGLAVTGAAMGNYVKPLDGSGTSHTVNYKITPDYTVDPGDYTGAYIYSVVPQP